LRRVIVMQEVDGFFKWIIGVVVAIFGTMFGTHRHMQNQLDKHREEIQERLASLTCVQKEDYRSDQGRLEDSIKDIGTSVEKNSNAIFKEIKSINEKIFAHVTHHENNHNNHG